MALSLRFDQRAELVELNRQEYGATYADLPFLSGESNLLAMRRRNELLGLLDDRVKTGCGGSKLDMRDLAPGCRICIAGDWSCLFVNGRCNAHCFYCPSRQDQTGLPTTNRLTFCSTVDYVAYLEQFGFRGMSLSGGEPLLTPGRCLAFLSAAKHRFGSQLHAWMYTNGTRIDREMLLRLVDAGLDELRFDIGAVNYGLDKARLAVGIVPTVTVEIPAVPEDRQQLMLAMVEMADAGINYLNLHQLRLTPYNSSRFAGRPYTYLHGEKVTVLESELLALEMIHYSYQKNLGLPVNYCSFVYKNRYQRAAARRRSGLLMRKPYEALTSAGYLRTLALSGPEPHVQRILAHLRRLNQDPNLWAPGQTLQRIYVSPESCLLCDLTGVDLIVSYSECTIRDSVSYRHPFKEIKLPSGRKAVVERRAVTEVTLSGEGVGEFICHFLQHAANGLPSKDRQISGLLAYESVGEGLQDYF
ncbi:MAG: radical SAM protein [Deltaproteobacteria bacterium]|jgi:pyruvate formate-lyase activating enzyme-like uncharacterized protein|nr:radical SAM protein [Deltaproteobacteria bacterium]